MPVGELRALLFGTVVCDRPDDASACSQAVGEGLNALLAELVLLLKDEHTDESRAFRQAERELAEVQKMPSGSAHAVACKRGVVLFALWREPAFAERFRASDDALVADLTTRVLPIVAPMFLANLGQRPDTFVAMCATLCTLWAGEPLALRPGWQRSGSTAVVIT